MKPIAFKKEPYLVVIQEKTYDLYKRHEGLIATGPLHDVYMNENPLDIMSHAALSLQVRHAFFEKEFEQTEAYKSFKARQLLTVKSLP